MREQPALGVEHQGQELGLPLPEDIALITGGFVRRKDVPEKVSEEEALAIIHRAINSEGAKKL